MPTDDDDSNQVSRFLTGFKNKTGKRKEDFAAGPMSFESSGADGAEVPVASSFLEPSTPMIEERIQEDDGEDGIEKPSNEYVLNVAFYSFLAFMSVQAVFAIIARSQSMLADSEAMSVDALTYLFNLCAERIKNRPYSKHELSLPKLLREKRRLLRRLYLELVPPLISVTTLMVVTAYATKQALETLHGVDLGQEEEEVNVGIMFFFSGLNLLLDVVNVTCFARADQAFGLTSFPTEQHSHAVKVSSQSGGQAEVQDDDGEEVATERTVLIGNGTTGVDTKRKPSGSVVDETPPVDEFYGVNLNMCSAWTHICADTMRSIAVLIAASIAGIFPSIPGDDADSVAAIVVSAIIILSLLPLLHGLFLTAREIVLLSRTNAH